jgi:hypothetical protein
MYPNLMFYAVLYNFLSKWKDYTDIQFCLDKFKQWFNRLISCSFDYSTLEPKDS